jgi:uncharacterized protein
MNTAPGLIGVIHLPALAGAPLARGTNRDMVPAELLQRAGLNAVTEAKLLEKAGFEAIILENFGDAPFYKSSVPPETVASLAVIAAAVRESTRLQVGINVLRNDARSALAIAAVTGCEMIRVNVLSGVTASDQGLIEGDAATLLRERDRLGVSISIFADVHVKHARSLSSDDIALAVEETAGRGGADAVIVSGATTGRAISSGDLERAARAAREADVPIYIGSGASSANLAELLSHASGVIVSSALRRAGRAGAPLDARRVREFVRMFRSLRSPRRKRTRSR